MPCLSYDYDRTAPSIEYAQLEQLKLDKANLEAALCAALSFIEKSGRTENFIAATDWKEAGVTPAQVQSWWEDHKKKDQVRREKEAKAKAEEEKRLLDIATKVEKLKAKTWSELTKAEIKFLSTHSKK
jgi:hypothetical protein